MTPLCGSCLVESIWILALATRGLLVLLAWLRQGMTLNRLDPTSPQPQ